MQARTGQDVMRKLQYDQVMESVGLLRQAHDEIRTLTEKKDYRPAAGLLADCQESAIAVGTLLEQTEGESCPVIPLIEEYCEQLYRFHEELTGEQTGGAAGQETFRKMHKRLQQQLTAMENAVKHSVAVRREAVFLPYKASMWDSLESVWKAADADEACDAYVIPIPYYDKNPDGSFGAMHYEGDQYPAYVPVTDWRGYDFAERRPDAVFIHNPYDEFNYVTSVEPFYYAKNLKQYTAMLVYIPYFVLDEISPDNTEAVKGMEHFVTVPGVFHADRVIVQSEDMRRIYINVLVETFGRETRDVWEKKILGLGSPKLDRAGGTKKEDLEIPESWEKILYKPDGSRKKVVFYNNSVSALLQYDEKMIGKMKSVFAVFQEYRDTTALLWRPHPLIEATISSMRPGLWEEYRKIRDDYLEAGWGIYDDTADLERAIVLSDAYYGDPSSVVQLYKKTGKPIMIQNAEVTGD